MDMLMHSPASFALSALQGPLPVLHMEGGEADGGRGLMEVSLKARAAPSPNGLHSTWRLTSIARG
jgi:hypothetical protein